jgi:glucose-1-phosphate thymidylyltransferase
VKAYLLAAGYATRMFPLTRDCPKPLLEVAGAPILTHILDRVLELDGLSEVVVIGNARFAGHFEAWAAGIEAAGIEAAGIDCPVPLRVLDDGSTDDANKLGAIADLAFGLECVPTDGEDFLVAAGDNLLGFGLREIQRAFLLHGESTLTVRDVEVRDASRYNEVVLEPDGRVRSFREKPPDPVSTLAAIALYFFPASVAELLPSYLEQGGNPDAPGHFVAWLVERAPVRATRLPGEWYDIGSLDGLERARLHYPTLLGSGAC